MSQNYSKSKFENETAEFFDAVEPLLSKDVGHEGYSDFYRVYMVNDTTHRQHLPSLDKTTKFVVLNNDNLGFIWALEYDSASEVQEFLEKLEEVGTLAEDEYYW